MKKLFTPKTLHEIDLKGSPKVRSKVRTDVVDEYFDIYEAKGRMPEVELFEVEKGRYLVADGMHRVSAMMEFPEISKWAWTMNVRKGDYAECLRFALKANDRHGLRRSNEDKRQSVITALKEFPKVSNAQLAEITGTSDMLVAELKKELINANIIPKSDKVTGKDGVERPANLKNRRLDAQKPSKSEDSGEVDDEPTRVVAGKMPVKDAVGITVPDKALVYWERRNQVEEMMNTLSVIKCTIDKAQKAGDRMFVEISNSTLASLMMCRQEVSMALPYTVCPTCNGQLVEKCGLCRGRGVVSKELYSTVPVEIRNMREKMAKKK